MTENEARELLSSLTLEEKEKLLSFLVSLPSLENKVKELEKKYNIRLRTSNV